MIDPKLIKAVRETIGSPVGQCYVASEALYYLAGGKAAGIKPMRCRVDAPGTYWDGAGHWWLQDEDGSVVDVTAEQYDQPFPYHLGKGCGFQANKKRETVELLDKLTKLGYN